MLIHSRQTIKFKNNLNKTLTYFPTTFSTNNFHRDNKNRIIKDSFLHFVFASLRFKILSCLTRIILGESNSHTFEDLFEFEQFIWFQCC
jgi:hypothetical protein